MKRSFISAVLIITLFACTKESPSEITPEPTVSTSEFEALKQEVAELKSRIQDLTPGEQTQGVSVEEFNALKKENEELKSQISLFTSGFFEVDGLRFDRNGTLISVPKLAAEVSEKASNNKTLTTTRSYDTEGRLIEIYREYSDGISLFAGSPYYWQKVMYEYNGMSCKTTTRTYRSGLPAGTPYEEEVSEATYW